MEELNIKDLLKFYLNKSPIIIIITLIMFFAGYYYNEYIQVPMYHGTTTIILVQSDNNTSSNITQNEVSLNEKLISTYSEIIKSRRVSQKVINKLGLKITPSELKKKISVNEVSDTSIIEITVSDKDNELAALIANRVAKEFGREITAIYKLENVSVIDEAIVEDTPYNVNKTKQLLISTAIGFIISCAIIFIIYYFDNTIKSKKDIETTLNLPVLGEIPLAPKALKKEQKIKKENKKRNFKIKFKNNKKNQKEVLEQIVVEKTNTVNESDKKKQTKKSTSKSTSKKTTTKPTTKTTKETKKTKTTTNKTKTSTKSSNSKTTKKQTTTPKSKKKESDK